MIKPSGVCGAWPEVHREGMRDTIARLPPKEQRVCPPAVAASTPRTHQFRRAAGNSEQPQLWCGSTGSQKT